MSHQSHSNVIPLVTSIEPPELSRTILDLSPYNIGIFDEIGCYHYDSAQTMLAEHVHPGMPEFCFLQKGQQNYYVGNEHFHLQGGDIFFTKPDEPHGTGELPEEKGLLYWMIIKSPETVEEYLGLQKQEAQLIFQHLCTLPQRIFRSSPLVYRLLKKIFEIAPKKTPLAGIEIKSTIILLFLELIRLGESAEEKSRSLSMHKVIDYINEHLQERINLEQLAGMTNLSLSRFKHRFKDETGIPPAEFIVRKKIELSEKLLLNGCNIKDIAYRLDFSSPAHFSTTFRKYKGVSPLEYKEKSLSRQQKDS